MGKRMYLSLLVIMAVNIVVVSAFAQNIYTVQLVRDVSGSQLEKYELLLKDVPDTWMDFNRPVNMYSGLFLERKDAEAMLPALKKVFPEAVVKSVAFKAPKKWLPKKMKILLENLGYPIPLVIRGFRAYKDFHFPWSTSYNVKASKILLNVRFSPLLKETSTLQVVVEKIPLKTIKASGSDNIKTVEISLSELSNKNIGDYLDVEISGYFTITGDRCADELSGNLWAVLLPGSSLTIVEKHPPVSVEEFFKCEYLPVTLVVRNANKDSVEAACKLAGMIGATKPNKKSIIQISDHPRLGANVIVGDYKKDIQLVGTNVYVTPKGVNLLCSRWLPDLIGKNYRLISMAREQKERVDRVSFSELGMHDRVMKGIGDLTSVVSFTPLDLDGWPSDILCTLLFTHTPVRQKERAFLKARLNGVLVEAHEISGEGSVQSLTFNLPARYLQARNSLEITFSYYLIRGECHGSFPEMEVTLFKDSFLTIKSKRSKPPLNLSTYFTFLRGKGAVVADTENPKELTPLINLLTISGEINGVPPSIELTSRDKLSTNSYNFYILQLKPGSLHQLNPVIDLEPVFKIVNPLTGKVLLEFESSDPVSVLQTFYNSKGKPVLVYSSRAASMPPIEKLKRILIKGTRGNVSIFNNRNWQVMEVGEKLRVKYPFKKDIGYYWLKYKMVFIICAGFLVLLFLFYLYRRLSGREGNV